MTVAYVDASALTKLILDEAGSGAMRRWYLEADRVTCSVIGAIETRRAVARQSGDPEHLETILRSIIMLEVDEFVTRAAVMLRPATIRTLDAIHVATAQGLTGELDAFVTYDERQADAARAVGLPVVRPA